MSFIRRRKKTEESVENKSSGLLRRRKKVVEPQEYKEFPRGGHVPDPPEGCPWKKKFEKNGKYWTETYFCGFVCEDAVVCPAYKAFQKEQEAQRRRDRQL